MPPALVPESQPWTAARCHRLLRQLQSRLTALRKLDTEEPPEPPRQSKRPCSAGNQPRASKRARITYGRRRAAPARSTQQGDVVTPPRAMRTLGGMDLGKSSPVCGLVGLSTPMWRKISEQPDTPCHKDLGAAEASQTVPPEIASSNIICGLSSLREAVSEDKYRNYEAILRWLNGLLQSTMTQDQDVHRKSLLGLCLRAMPACIANIEAYERRAARERGCQTMWDASHVCFEIYEQLEALGSPGRGWRPMKLAVRAHAMTLLKEAVSEGLLEPEYVSLLVRLCLQLDCRAEAGKLVASVEMPLLTPRSLPSTFVESRHFLPCHEMLRSFRCRAGAAAPLHWLSSLFERGVLPVSCLSTQAFSAVLEASLESITTSRWGFSVAAFLSTCLPLLATVRIDDAKCQGGSTEQTLISMVAGVVAAATAARGSRGADKTQKRRRAWRRVLALLNNCMLEARRLGGRRRRQPGQDNGLFVFALARYLAVAKSPFANTTLEQQTASELRDVASDVGSSATIGRYYCQATTFLCWLAQYRSKSCAMPMQASVTELCSWLEGIDLGDCFGSCLQTDVAFVLAQKTKDLKDLVFAERLRGAGASAKASTMFSGWRWEEGISEWVLPEEVAYKMGKPAGLGWDATKSIAGEAPRKKNDGGGSITNRRDRGKPATSRESRSEPWTSSTRPDSGRLPKPLLGPDDWDDLV